MTQKIPEKVDETTIYVGVSKPIFAYVNAIMRASEKTKVVKVAGRGSVISDVVTIVEIAKRKLQVKSINVEIGSVPMINKFGKEVFVSTMVITLIL